MDDNLGDARPIRTRCADRDDMVEFVFAIHASAAVDPDDDVIIVVEPANSEIREADRAAYAITSCVNRTL